MIAVEEPTTGRFSVEVELTNHEDLVRAKAGLILPEHVRAREFVVSLTAAPRAWSFRRA